MLNTYFKKKNAVDARPKFMFPNHSLKVFKYVIFLVFF